ncbi:MAG TPA: SAM-dependent methyltransferase [Polyangia bacterium]|nr:SAM-dependent methyltransferase [Polyangia bacterium]
MHTPIVMRPVGVVVGTRKEPTDDDWSQESAEIVLDDAQFSGAALAGVADFSHVLVLYVMHGVAEGDVEMEARHPRNRADWPKVGIFAQRAKRRPNRIGLACCRVLGVEGLRVRVADLDAIDGTPVLDVKPWVREFGPRGDVAQPAWMTELMQGYF